MLVIKHQAKAFFHSFNLTIQQPPTNQVHFTNTFTTKFPGTFIHYSIEEVRIILRNFRRTGSKCTFTYFFQSLTGCHTCRCILMIRSVKLIHSLSKHQINIRITHYNPVDTGSHTAGSSQVKGTIGFTGPVHTPFSIVYIRSIQTQILIILFTPATESQCNVTALIRLTKRIEVINCRSNIATTHTLLSVHRALLNFPTHQSAHVTGITYT